MKKVLTGMAVGAAALTLWVAPAQAGEITGNGEKSLQIAPHQLHGKSACAWSGQNDGYFDGSETTHRVQSYGYDITFRGLLDDIFPGATPKDFNPGDACRGNVEFEG